MRTSFNTRAVECPECAGFGCKSCHNSGEILRTYTEYNNDEPRRIVSTASKSRIFFE